MGYGNSTLQEPWTGPHSPNTYFLLFAWQDINAAESTTATEAVAKSMVGQRKLAQNREN
jgi:hypothetical protein